MVFSFFKKDQKDTKAGVDRTGARVPARSSRPEQKPVSRPLNGPVNRSLNRPSNIADPASGGGGFAVTENALPNRELARSLAMATAAKIDAIESEMARDFLRPRKAGSEGVELPADAESVEAAAPPIEVPAVPPPAPQAQGSAASRRAEAEKAEEDAFDPGSEILAGSIDAIEVNGGSSSVLDETAILFANRQDQAAENGLRTAIATDALGPVTERGCLMLLELMQQRGDRAAYDQFAAQFAARFGEAAPAWINYSGSEPPRPVVKSGTPSVALPETIDAGIVKALEEFKTIASTHPALTLDVSATRTIDLVGAELLLRVFNAFKRASHELTVRGAEQLLTVLRTAVEPGRRDSSDAAWMLLLELQRLLDRQADFEETGIQYCITYEVSPPSWEPPLPNIRATSAGDAPVAVSRPPPDGLEWKGEVQGDADALLGRLMQVASESKSKRVTVECRQLRRIAFSSATSLLGQLIKLQQLGFTVEFRNVNSLIVALWQLLGVAAVAEVHVRRA